MLTKHILEVLKIIGSASTSTIFSDHYYAYKYNKQKAKNINVWQPAVLENAGRYKKKELQKLSNLLYYLKKKGLVENKSDKKEGVWAITPVGEDRLNIIRAQNISQKPFLYCNQLKKGEFKVIVFDIPEADKRKRDWLRQSLVNLGFEMLQRSVWVGETKLPEEFIGSLNELELLSRLHIFIVKEKGTINFSA